MANLGQHHSELTSGTGELETALQFPTLNFWLMGKWSENLLLKTNLEDILRTKLLKFCYEHP